MGDLLGRVVIALFCLAAPVFAQDRQRWEISPFAGYETSGSYPVISATGVPGTSFFPLSGTGSTSTIDRLRVNSGVSFGTFLDYSVLQDLQLEFLWTRNPTTYSQHDFTTGAYTQVFDSTVDQFEFGILYPFGRGGFYGFEKKFQPFLAGGLGFAHESNTNGNPNRTAFAFNLGGGIKYYISKNFGLRGDIRWMPNYANSTPEFACDIFGNCFNIPKRNFEQRANFTGGIISRF